MVIACRQPLALDATAGPRARDGQGGVDDEHPDERRVSWVVEADPRYLRKIWDGSSEHYTIHLDELHQLS